MGPGDQGSPDQGGELGATRRRGCETAGAAGLAAPLPLAGEVDARSAAGGGSLNPTTRGGTPTPTLPRKRERERTAFAETRNYHDFPVVWHPYRPQAAPSEAA